MAISSRSFHFSSQPLPPRLPRRLDPRLRASYLLDEEKAAAKPVVTREGAGGKRRVDVLAKLHNPEDQVPGLAVVCRVGSIVTGTVAVEDLAAVRERVVSLKESVPVRTSLDVSVDEIRCGNELHQRLPNVDGMGVILGVVDRGCDFAHPNFRHRDGSTRLLFLWDQTQEGSPPAPAPFGYGREFTPAELRPGAVKTPTQALQAGDYAVPPEAHGTRVLDIATGNGGHDGVGTGFSGVAPAADLIFVELAATGHLISSRRLLEAVDYIFRKAGDRPAVVNLSLESYAGPHDGHSLLEEAFDLLLAQPGRAIVIAAGNSRAKKIHSHGTVAVGRSAELAWTLALNEGSEDECEIWYPGTGKLQVFLKPPGATEELGPFSPGDTHKVVESGSFRGYVLHEQDDPNNHDNQILLRLPPVPENGGVWTVRLRNIGEVPVTFHAWIERDDSGQSFFLDATEEFTLNALACGHLTLAVGAYSGHLQTKVPAPFSSLGPTRDGRPKPDLYAPGVEVNTASAHSVYVRTNRGDGTSLAAPHVSGVAALLLQAGGGSANVRGLLTSTARGANPEHGVDGLAALTGLPPAAMALPLSLAGNPAITDGVEGIADRTSALINSPLCSPPRAWWRRLMRSLMEVDMRRKLWISLLLLMGSSLLVACNPGTRQEPAAVDGRNETKLWHAVIPEQGEPAAAGMVPPLMVEPGDPTEATEYYKKIRPNLEGFPQPTLADSSISDMLIYYGFPALPPSSLEDLAPDVIMDFEQLRQVISTPEFDAAYGAHPLQAGEILVTRFFAPKIINVRDKQVDGVPQGGFGWRKVLRFRSREGSLAKAAGLDSFYLLFNFTSGNGTTFPEKIHAAQIQALLVPTYPTAGKHRDAYFLVYESLGSSTPGKVGQYLLASFDLAGAVSDDDKYYVPRACGQCHGTDVDDQKGAKVNYLDTDHWIDRTGDDFKKVPASNVLVDGTPSYATLRQLNSEIEKQNDAVINQSGGSQFALLAVRKWLELHREGQPDADQHVPPLRRGFAEKSGDALWTQGASPDAELLPLLNQYCFRCHSSVRYHIFQKQAVLSLKSRIRSKVKNGTMPQDRTLEQSQIDKILALVDQLK